MHKVFIGIGSNLGTRQAHIIRALNALQLLPCCRLKASSDWYFNPPLGLQHQGHYLNGVVELDTTLSPTTLLTKLKTIERAIGRKQKRKRWGPRVIDLDILLFGEYTISLRQLKIPHSQLWLRDFTIVPLMELHDNLPACWQTLAQQAEKNLQESKLARTPLAPTKRAHWRPNIISDPS